MQMRGKLAQVARNLGERAAVFISRGQANLRCCHIGKVSGLTCGSLDVTAIDTRPQQCQ